jgi:undecaprenyl-diphosphatase
LEHYSEHQKTQIPAKSPPWYRPLRDALRWVGGHEASLLISLILLAGTIWIFIFLADEVLEGETRALDTKILVAMRSPMDTSDPIGPIWLEEMGRDFTALGGTGVLTMILLLVSGYLMLIRKFHALILMLMAIGGAWILSLLLKGFFGRPRPDLIPHEAAVYNASFPSGHAMISAAFYLTLGVLLSRVHARRRIQGYFLTAAMIITLIVGISRIYLGVHWPSDVLAGWTLGSAWAILCWLLTRWLQRRGKVEGQADEVDED